MRGVLASTVVVAAVLMFVGGAVLSTLRAEARGPLAVGSGDLLDAASLEKLHLFVSAGGQVRAVLPNAMIVRTLRGATRRIDDTHARFLQRVDARHDLPVTRDALEPGAHVAALGLPSGARFYAYTVRISPHRHAIGGRVDHIIGRDVLEISNRRGAFFVRVARSTLVHAGRKPFRGPLSVGLHVATLAAPDPRDLVGGGLFLAGTVDVLPTPVIARVGGIITRIDPVSNTITIYSKVQARRYTIEVTRTTKMTLNKWTAGYGDMTAGDHLTVSGVLDPANGALGPNPIVARRIRIGSPNFSGVIAAVTPARAPAAPGSLLLTVRASRGHVLRVTAPGKATVVYGQQSARVLDLLPGQKIAARGLRTDKFALTAAIIHVYPHQRTVGGVVQAVIAGGFRIVSPISNTQFLIHGIIGLTKYTLGSQNMPASRVVVGTHIRVRGYDALHNDQRAIPIIMATHVNIIVHHVHKRKVTHHTRSTKRKAAKPAPTPAPQKATLIPAKVQTLVRRSSLG